MSETTDTVDTLYFTYDGVKYSLPPFKTWPLEAQEAQEDGRDVAAVKLILGDKQFKIFRSKSRTVGDLQDIVEKIFDTVAKALEVEKGE